MSDVEGLASLREWKPGDRALVEVEVEIADSLAARVTIADDPGYWVATEALRPLPAAGEAATEGGELAALPGRSEAEIKAEGAREALLDAADLVAPFSGIAMGMCPTRSEWSAWLRDRAARLIRQEGDQ